MEAGNAKAMREALERLKRLFDGRLMWQSDIRKAHEAVNAALSTPARNCDVGTPEEQSKRYEAYCAEFGRHSDGSPKCIGCPLETRAMKTGGMCELAWAQMPYESK